MLDRKKRRQTQKAQHQSVKMKENYKNDIRVLKTTENSETTSVYKRQKIYTKITSEFENSRNFVKEIRIQNE